LAIWIPAPYSVLRAAVSYLTHAGDCPREPQQGPNSLQGPSRTPPRPLDDAGNVGRKEGEAGCCGQVRVRNTWMYFAHSHSYMLWETRADKQGTRRYLASLFSFIHSIFLTFFPVRSTPCFLPSTQLTPTTAKGKKTRPEAASRWRHDWICASPSRVLPLPNCPTPWP
jgi:hypothetical protein